MRAVLIASCMSTMMVMACSGQNMAEEAELSKALETEQLAQGNNSSVQSERMTVIRDERGLEMVWSEIRRGDELPEVDFENQMVLAVFMGERRTGGHRVRVGDVSRDGEGLRVRVDMSAPGRNCMTTQAFTQPYQIVRLPRVDGPVAFDVDQREVDC